MSLKLTLKHKIGSWFPAKLKESVRLKKGKNLNENPSILIVCRDNDEHYFKELRKFVQHIKGEFGVRDVMVLFYSDVQEAELPIYLGHLKEYDYFCVNDLNWRLKPRILIDKLNQTSYDILIDLCPDKCLPVGYVISESKAHFKVGRAGSEYCEFMDLIINIHNSRDEKEFLKQAEYHLSKLSFS